MLTSEFFAQTSDFSKIITYPQGKVEVVRTFFGQGWEKVNISWLCADVPNVFALSRLDPIAFHLEILQFYLTFIFALTFAIINNTLYKALYQVFLSRQNEHTSAKNLFNTSS